MKFVNKDFIVLSLSLIPYSYLLLWIIFNFISPFLLKNEPEGESFSYNYAKSEKMP